MLYFYKQGDRVFPTSIVLKEAGIDPWTIRYSFFVENLEYGEGCYYAFGQNLIPVKDGYVI